MKNGSCFFRSFLPVVLAGVAALSGCRSTPTEPSGGTPEATGGVYVVNEGNFMRGNSTLTFYLPDSNKAFQDVFALANGRNLGDTGNDIVLCGGKAYIVVSGSQKIEVISVADNKSVGTLTFSGQRNPYKLVVLNDARAYVTNLSDTTVTAFNPSTLQIINDRIRVGKNPEGIAGANGKLYVCNSGFGGDSTVTVLNASTGGLIKTIYLDVSPSEVGVGPNNEVIVKCDGKSDYANSDNDTPGSISVINSDNDVVIIKAMLPLPTYGHPGKMTVGNKGYGYFVGKTGIIRFSFTGSTLSVEGTPFSTVQAYSLAVDDATDRIYATDAKDYVQAGEVAILDSKGVELKRFTAGIIPGAIAFKR